MEFDPLKAITKAVEHVKTDIESGQEKGSLPGTILAMVDGGAAEEAWLRKAITNLNTKRAGEGLLEWLEEGQKIIAQSPEKLRLLALLGLVSFMSYDRGGRKMFEDLSSEEVKDDAPPKQGDK